MAIEAQMYSKNLGFPLFGSQDWMVENCGGGIGGFSQFSFNAQQKHQLQQQFQQQQLQLQNQQQIMDQNLCFENSIPVPTLENNSSNIMASSFSQTFEAQAAKQRQEIDQYIRLQSERLRMMLQEQRKQQLAMLLKKIDSKTQVLLKQKDEEITQANRRQMELEDFLRKLEAENLAWQRVAQENEAMVMTLNNTLEQYRERAMFCNVNGGEDAESCCGNYREEEGESDGGGGKKMKACRRCNSGSSCVLFLPCRHLCSCKDCEAVLDYCPVCRTPKKASIEALLF
ncbi:hypothetical protein C1H46_018125 [Malus baccata]|uniref:RING-type domain-containing protein n=1 Tax=Malus baccata TaxID=106549 RepID=A0A540MD53_MALBA|nr:hypothetical protein C1H46_018125 [Malus baccata]